MRWFLRALLLAYFLTLTGTAGAAKPLVRWVTDKPFARMVATALGDNLSALTITCRRPVLPKKFALSVALPQEDCLVIAVSHSRVLCGEFAYDNGPIPPVEIACATVARSFAKDVKPSDILRFHWRHGPAA